MFLNIPSQFKVKLTEFFFFKVDIASYSRRQYKVSIPFKKPVVLRCTNVSKTITVTVFTLTNFKHHLSSNSAQIHQ